MSHFKTTLYFILATSVFCLYSCGNDSRSTEANDGDTTSESTLNVVSSSVSSYDPAMDPVTTGGQMIKKLIDTLGVKMYEFAVKPGESWGLHTHPDHTVYMLQGGRMVLYMREAGRQDTLTFPTGMSLASGPLTDSGKNIGKTVIKMLVTDIYRPRAK